MAKDHQRWIKFINEGVVKRRPFNEINISLSEEDNIKYQWMNLDVFDDLLIYFCF